MDNQANVAVYSSGKILPAWDLSDLYDGMNSSDLTYDLTMAASTADVFARDYMGKLAELGPDEFGGAIREYEDLNELLSRIMSYAQLLLPLIQRMGEIANFYQNMSEQVTAVSAKALFLNSKPNRLKDAEINVFLSSAAVVRYKPGWKMSGCISLINSRMRSRGYCTKNPLPAEVRGPDCLMKLWPACALNSMAES